MMWNLLLLLVLVRGLNGLCSQGSNFTDDNDYDDEEFEFNSELVDTELIVKFSGEFIFLKRKAPNFFGIYGKRGDGGGDGCVRRYLKGK
jgi:hypothetical protein